MSAYYLIDTHAPTLAAARILDVVDGASFANMTGASVIRVPDYISVQDPSSVSNLLTKKYAGLLAFYSGFTFSYVTYDDLLDTLGINLTVSSGILGQRGNVSLQPSNILVSTATPLVGLPPASAVVTWESFSVAYADPAGGHTSRQYNEEAASDLTCFVSFDGGATFLPATDGATLTIPPASQGTSFIIRFTNTAATRRYVGSWAVLY